MNAMCRDHGPIVLMTRDAPTAAALDDDIFLTLPVAGPSAGQVESVDVFLTVDFARAMIAELQAAIEAATKAGL
jgi:hypothetical protein